MLTSQGLLSPLFSVVAAAVMCPGVPCQVRKHRFLCLTSSHGKDVSAVSYFAFLQSCATFTPLLASQGEVCNEECWRLQDCQTKIMWRNSWLKKSLQSFTIHKYLDECQQLLVISPAWRKKTYFHNTFFHLKIKTSYRKCRFFENKKSNSVKLNTLWRKLNLFSFEESRVFFLSYGVKYV